MATSILARLAPPRLTRRALVAGAVAAAAVGRLGAVLAQTMAPEASERSIKAAFLYKFAQYVDWPASSAAARSSPFTIGVLGSGAFADELSLMTANRTVGERPVGVRRVAPNDAVDDLQVLFVAAEQRGALSELLLPAKGRPILTVTEAEGALIDGSIINFIVSGQRVRFEVSLDAAQANGLRLNSRLLAVAHNIRQSQPP